MRSRRHRWGRAAASAFSAFALVSGGAVAASPALAEETPADGESAPPKEDTIMRVSTAGFVDSFNPFTSIYAGPTGINRYVYEPLVAFAAEDGMPTEGLAESWETNDDGTEWTFHIRPDMKWSDGEAITAEDPAYTFTQIMSDPAMGVANGNEVENFESAEAVDDTTLKITLKEAQASIPGIGIPIAPEHVWSAKDAPAEDTNDSDVVGSGPFVLESYAANQNIRLKKNENFWRGEPKIDGIDYIYYTNNDATVQALRAGEIDVVGGLTANEFDALEGTENIEVNPGEGRRFTAIGINPGMESPSGEAYGTGAEALKDVKVRQAIRLGIDLDTLRENVMQGYATKATSFVPSAWSTWALPEDSDVLVDFDPDAAKALLDEAGWTEGSDGIREKDGEKLEIRFMYDAANSQQQTISEYLGPWMENIGIALVDDATDVDTTSERHSKADFDLYMTGWRLNPDPGYQLGINTCASRPEADGSGPTSMDGYCNPEFDELVAQQAVELDEDKRAELVHKALETHYEDVPSITLWYDNSLEAYRSDRFEGFEGQPGDGGAFTNQAGYWGFYNVEPVEGGGSSGGASTGLLVGGGVIVAALAAGGLVLARRKKTADDRA